MEARVRRIFSMVFCVWALGLSTHAYGLGSVRGTVRDATDVAVILPELSAAFEGELRPGVVTDVFGDGKTLKMRYGFREYPSLVFVREGEYVGTISRVQDWSEYLRRIGELMVAAPRRAPGFSVWARARRS